jgi:hypothetical protein
MKLRLKTPYHKEPPKGWHWIRDGIEFRADSPEAVLEKVKQYQIINGRAPGDLMSEFVQYVSEHWPNLVCEDHSLSAPACVEPAVQVLVNQHALGLKPLLNVPEKKEAEAREAMCKICPHNRRFRGDPQVIEAINRRAFMLTKGKLLPLGYCNQYLWDNRVAVQWDKTLLQLIKNPAVTVAVPCWFASHEMPAGKSS